MSSHDPAPLLFFISYVHDSGEDDQLVHRFFRDLDHDVLMFAGRRHTETAGFCDVSFQLGQQWSPALIESLSTTQVFVPILSPVYFASDACGREWSIFTSRLQRSGRSSAPDSSIIPLLWVPMSVPEIAQPYQYKEAAFGTEYDTVKLRALIREERRRDDYHAFVELLARRIVDLSRAAPVLAATERPGFDDVSSSFATPPHPAPGRPAPYARRPRSPAPERADRPILNANLTEDPR